MIPRIIVSAWFGGGPKAEIFQRCLSSWKSTNPEWEIVIVDESTFPELMRQPYMRAAQSRKEFVKCTELARLWGVFACGGIYLDLDVELIGSLEPLRDPPGGAFFIRQGDGLVNGCAFGAEPSHWVIRQLITRFPSETDASKAAVEYGPMFLTPEVEMFHAAVHFVPTETFLPFDWTEKDDPPTSFGHETIGVHRWVGSWDPTFKLPPRG